MKQGIIVTAGQCCIFCKYISHFLTIKLYIFSIYHRIATEVQIVHRIQIPGTFKSIDSPLLKDVSDISAIETVKIFTFNNLRLKLITFKGNSLNIER